MPTIHWMSEERFSKLPKDPTAVAVSIRGSFNLNFNEMSDGQQWDLLAAGWKACLKLCFDDVLPNDMPATDDHPQANETFHPMSEDQADLLLEFIQEHGDQQDWFIHCAAGMSRSAAVAQIVHEITGLPFRGLEVPDFKFANGHILRLCHRRMWGM